MTKRGIDALATNIIPRSSQRLKFLIFLDSIDRRKLNGCLYCLEVIDASNNKYTDSVSQQFVFSFSSLSSYI